MTDLILHNANVITMDPIQPSAKLVAIEKGEITAVTSDKFIPSADTRKSLVIDCRGRTLLPGIIDAHCHFRAYAESLMTMDFRPENGFHSMRDIQSEILERTRIAPSGDWIRGQGYHESDLLEKRHPTRWDLDPVSPNHPVKISHRTGHAHVLNSLALKLVGLSRYSPDPEGCMTERNLKTGEPTGVLYEMGSLLAERIPPLDEREMEKGIEKANHSFISHGITSFYDASSRNNTDKWKKMIKWKGKGLILPRVGMFFNPSLMKHLENLFSPIDSRHIRVLGVKVILDETTGKMFPSQRDLNRIIIEAHQRKLQVAIHSVEEAAIESACSALEEALMIIPTTDHRHRLEHCSLCPEDIMDRINSLGAIVVTQPGFIYQNGDRYLATVLEEKQAYLYPIRSMMEKGIRIAAGSDCPIGPINPFLGLYGAITRNTQNGNYVRREQNIDLNSALSLYTYNAAFTAFEEDFKGSIVTGKAADLALLSQNISDGDMEDLKETRVDMTIISGKIVWNNIT